MSWIKDIPGQTVKKTETGYTESWLKVRQAAIALAAFLWAFFWLILSLLVIGDVLITIAGLCLMGLLEYGLIKANLKWLTLMTLELKIVGTLGIVAAAVLWVVLGDPVRREFWPPVHFNAGNLYIAGDYIVKAPYWARFIALVVCAAACGIGVAVAYSMGIEIFDSNWPPTYQPRDPGEGPWSPFGERKARVMEAADGEVLPFGVTFQVPITDEVDLQQVAEYGSIDTKKKTRKRW